MVDYSLFTNKGGRSNNEDYVACAKHGEELIFILCDGLGGHDRGEVASEFVANTIAKMFEDEGDSPDFLDKAFTYAQQGLLNMQQSEGAVNAMKTTAVVLVVTPDIVKWAHIGDSRLYHFFMGQTRYERTRDHSLVQYLCDTGEIKDEDIRNHPDRNKVLRVMGAEWGQRTYDKSAMLETESGHSFALMSDGFWEYVNEMEMITLLNNTRNADEWLGEMEKLVAARADMTKTDNYSCICVKIQ